MNAGFRYLVNTDCWLRVHVNGVVMMGSAMIVAMIVVTIEPVKYAIALYFIYFIFACLDFFLHNELMVSKF